MSLLFQVVPLYLESDSEARTFFGSPNFNDLDTITGSRIIVHPPKSMIGLFEEEGQSRFPGLQSRDLPCLWVEDDTKANFHLSIRELRSDLLRDLVCDLSDATESAASLVELEREFRSRQCDRARQSTRPEMPKAKEGVALNRTTERGHNEIYSPRSNKGKEDKKSDQFDWTIGWGRIAGIGGLALAAFVTILLKFQFPILPTPYIPMLLVLLYGVAIFGCAIWMMEKLKTRHGQQSIATTIALPLLFLSFALAFGILASLTLPGTSSRQVGSPQNDDSHQSEKEKSGDDSIPVIAVKDEPEIHGIVLDAGGRAAGGALVAVAGYGKDAAFTNATGSFVLPSHTARLGYVTLHAERPPDGPANLDNYIVGSGTATLRLGPAAIGGTGKHDSSTVRPKTIALKPDAQNSPQDTQTAKSSRPNEAAASQNVCESFQQFMGSESALATLAEKAFSRKNYECVVTYLEQAKSVESSGVWERDFPFLAAAYLLARSDRTSFKGALNEMLGEMRRPNSFLHHGPTIGMAVSNLSEVRPYLDLSAQKTIDETIKQATLIRAAMPN